jgi:hypothetical protein
MLLESLVSKLKCRYMQWLGLFGRLNLLPGNIVDNVHHLVSVFFSLSILA